MSQNIVTLPMPFGWFCIGYSDELEIGEVRNVHYFDRDMVLFRTESGDLGLVDPICPHLGAHLGHGGTVVGESIRCPFHHWSYDKKGNVTDVPYTKRIPLKAQKKNCLNNYPVQDRNKGIWAWYHPDNVEPFTDLIDLPELDDPEWIELERHQWTFKSNVQDIAENGVDFAHFRYIHEMDDLPEGGEIVYEGEDKFISVEGELTSEFNGKTETFTQRIEINQHGAGLKWDRFLGRMETLLLVLVTPIDARNVEMRFAFTHKRYPEDSFEHMSCRHNIESTLGPTGVYADLPIWDNKEHIRYPLVCEGDGPIMRFRKYFEQFYVDGNPYPDD